MKNFNAWMKGRMIVETIEEEKRLRNDITPHGLVEIPGSHDVVFRSGTTNQSHLGNMQYRDLLESRYDDFCTLRANESKQGVLKGIMKAVEQNGGRFLEWTSENSCWMVMQDPAQIRTKVYSSLFHMHKQVQAKKNVQVYTSSTFLFERQDGRKRKRNANGEEPTCCS